ncbi:MAG TPA: TIGR03808 family TAT-translocated repetitive protein [Devosiaceae bacterium]
MHITRRRVLGGLAVAAGSLPLAALAQAQGPAGPSLLPGSGQDQTAALQQALDRAALEGGSVYLAAGTYRIDTIRLPSGISLSGIPGATILVSMSGAPILTGRDASAISLSGLVLEGNGGGSADSRSGLLSLSGCEGVVVRDCQVRNGAGNGIFMFACSGLIDASGISGCAKTGLFSLDATGLVVRGCRVDSCRNGGMRVWRSKSGHDGTIVSQNRIHEIAADAGGNGENGNGINIFRADGVVVSDNVIENCAFSAVRANSTNNSQIRGNTCTDLGEVAIYSEFAFSGSVIANNIIDGAALGISMTNFDNGGHLAVCSGNIVRNILPASRVNPDTSPVGIAAEADAVVTGNLIESVPGTGIAAGWGPYLRDVNISDNVIRDTEIGIAVSVAQGAGSAVVGGNLISGARQAGIAAMAWREIKSVDLAADADRFPNVTLSGNRVG